MRGALWALGTLAFLGGGGYAVLSVMAASMSDAPQSGFPDGLVDGGLLACAGVVMIAAGFAFK